MTRFDNLVERVGRVEHAEPLEATIDNALQGKVTNASIRRRKKMVIRAGARLKLRMTARNPVNQFPIVLCRLLDANASKVEALTYVRLGMRYEKKQDHFAKSALSRIWYQFGWLLEDYFRKQEPSVKFREELKSIVTRCQHFLNRGTENHAAMWRTAGYLFGASFPDQKFHYGITGSGLATECKKYMHAYGQTIFSSGMSEYLSPAYHAYNTAAWLNIVEFSQNEEVSSMANAILDWMMVDYALNYHHGIILPGLQRDKGLITTNMYMHKLENTYQMSHARAPSQWTGWLYWGGGNTPQDEAEFFDSQYTILPRLGTPAMLHAVSTYTPHTIIRNIGAKRVKTPYMVWQSRGNWQHVEKSQLNAYGRRQLSPRATSQNPNPRYQMRSVYVARNYAIGASYRHKDLTDPDNRLATPFSIVWRSKNPLNWLIVAHPYWYTARRRRDDDASDPWLTFGGPPRKKARKQQRDNDSAPQLGSYDWTGVSPFCQMVHWENATILLFNIPEYDPYDDKEINAFGGKRHKSVRMKRPLQAVYVYAPETVDERITKQPDFFLRENNVYIAIRPFPHVANWEAGGHDGFQRLAIPGGLVGVAIEVGDKREYGSFRNFQNRIASSSLDLSRLVSQKRVTYQSTRGHKLGIRYQTEGWLPEASVNGVRLEFDRWPIFQSPYATCRDRVLDVNDGQQGFTVDWRGNLPVHTSYDLLKGRKVYR